MSPPPSLWQRIHSGVIGSILVTLGYAVALFVLPVLIAALCFAFLPGSIGPVLGISLAVLAFVLVLGSYGLKSYPVTAFGTQRRVDEDLFVHEREQCVECGARIDRGQKRTYAEQVVAFGFPLLTTDWGETAYCPWCADGLVPPHLQDEGAERTSRSTIPNHADESEEAAETAIYHPSS